MRTRDLSVDLSDSTARWFTCVSRSVSSRSLEVNCNDLESGSTCYSFASHIECAPRFKVSVNVSNENHVQSNSR